MISFHSYDHFKSLHNSVKFSGLLAKINERSLLETKYWNFLANIKDHNFEMKTLIDLNKNHMASMKFSTMF